MAESSNRVLRLEEQATLQNAKEICDLLHEAVASRTNKVIVHGSDISELDVSVLQLLVAASKAAKADGTDFSVAFPANGVFDQTLQRAGFAVAGEQLSPAESDLWQRQEG